MKSIRYIMYFVLMSMTMSLLAQENAQAVAQGENKIDKKERSGIPVDMHMIQHQHLQQYQSDKPLYSL